MKKFYKFLYAEKSGTVRSAFVSANDFTLKIAWVPVFDDVIARFRYGFTAHRSIDDHYPFRIGLRQMLIASSDFFMESELFLVQTIIFPFVQIRMDPLNAYFRRDIDVQRHIRLEAFCCELVDFADPLFTDASCVALISD